MEKNAIHKALYNSPIWEVLTYLVAHPDQPLRGSDLVKSLSHISKSAIYNALRVLEKIGEVTQEKPKEYALNMDSAGLHSLMRFHHETLLLKTCLKTDLSSHKALVL